MFDFLLLVFLYWPVFIFFFFHFVVGSHRQVLGEKETLFMLIDRPFFGFSRYGFVKSVSGLFLLFWEIQDFLFYLLVFC